MRCFLSNTLLIALSLSLHTAQSAADDKKDVPVVEPCTVKSATGSFYDLRTLTVPVPIKDIKPGKNDLTQDWHAKGHDYQEGKANFTLNICAPVIGEVKNVVGVEKDLWRNVSAHYTVGGKTYSIGTNSSALIQRGRRLVLQYTDGSPCDDASSSSPDDDKRRSSTLSTKRRKSTIISFHCDKDPLATLTTSSVTYVGVSPDQCAYSFEVLSPVACLTTAPIKQGVGPGAVFFIIGIIAILVYFLGGVFYQRNVAHARGWRQLPNYSMWAGIGSFIKVSVLDRIIPARFQRALFPRVQSVRDGILPTMEVRPPSGNGNGVYGPGGKKWSKSHGQYTSRNSWDSRHQS